MVEHVLGLRRQFLARRQETAASAGGTADDADQQQRTDGSASATCDPEQHADILYPQLAPVDVPGRTGSSLVFVTTQPAPHVSASMSSPGPPIEFGLCRVGKVRCLAL